MNHRRRKTASCAGSKTILYLIKERPQHHQFFDVYAKIPSAVNFTDLYRKCERNQLNGLTKQLSCNYDISSSHATRIQSFPMLFKSMPCWEDSEEHVMRFLTWGNVDDLFNDGVLGFLILLPAFGVLLVQRAQLTASEHTSAWIIRWQKKKPAKKRAAFCDADIRGAVRHTCW